MKLRLILVFAFSITIIKSAISQESDSTDVSGEKEVYDFILINAKYQNAFHFLGRDFGENIPLFSTDMMYYFHSGLYFNASTIKFMQAELPWQYALSLGYNKDLSEKTDLNLSYSQFFVNEKSDITGIQNLGFLQGTLGWEWGLLYSNIQAQFLFNEQTDYFLSSSHSRYFESDKKLFKKVTLSFEPKFTLMAGTSRFYQNGYDLIDQENQDLEKFQLLSWEAVLPVAFGIGYWDIEFHTRYINPLNIPSFDESRKRFIFTLQTSYAIPIKKTKKL
ncbi:hypothetical protein ACFSKL_05470 [Belliella marina]|uniref:Outer membrane protein beta-barrel domain-containing protein n=1 Tax=Belliella marina TaxID=1644146 RepID=A0ABW4VNA2_9BACT